MGGGEWMEQQIIDVNPEVVVNIPKKEVSDYWWLLLVAIIPVMLTYMLKKK